MSTFYLPLGLANREKILEASGKKDTEDYVRRQLAAQALTARINQEVQDRLEQQGPLPGLPTIPASNSAPQENFTPAFVPEPGDPLYARFGIDRSYSPLGPSPKLTAQDLAGDKAPAVTADGVGGPEKPVPKWAQAPVVDAPKGDGPKWAQAPVVGDTAAPPARESTGSVDDAINEAVDQIPGGYKAWLEKNYPAPPGYSYALDPIAKDERYTLQKDFNPETHRKVEISPGVERIEPKDPTATDTPADPWNEQVAKVIENASNSLVDITRGQNPRNLGNELLTTFTTGQTQILPMLFRNPAQFVETVDPAHQLLRANNAFGEGVVSAVQGDFGKAAEKASEFIGEGGSGVLGVMGARSAPHAMRSGWRGVTEAVDRAMPGGEQRAVDRAAAPVLESHAQTLAAVIADAPVRPQALDAIVRILARSKIPPDRIEAGLRRVVDVAKEPARRPATVTQLLQREFGDEYPEVIDNLHTVVRERGLSKKKGDGSATIVRDTTQAMRGSQSDFLRKSAAENLDAGAREVLPEDFLQGSARRNFGITARDRLADSYLSDSANRHFGNESRMSTIDDADANMEILSQEAYTPILRQPIDDHTAEQLTEVLMGPGMDELMTPLRQMAAGEGLDVQSFITRDPLGAAHWMQHKARLLSEQNARKDNDTLAQAYANMRGRILRFLDPLQHPDQPGYTYRDARHEFADEIGRQVATNFGNRFMTQALDPLATDKLKRAYDDLGNAEKKAALQSVRDAIQKQLNMGRPGAGPDAILSRPAVLQAFETVFGEPGRGFANDMRRMIAHDRAAKFGDSFMGKAADEMGVAELKQTYEGMSSADRQTALQALRDSVLRQLNQTGASGNSLMRRPAVLQALEDVFGAPGQAFARDVRRLVSHEEANRFGDQFLTKAADDFASGQMKAAYEGMSPADQKTALRSVRDAIIRQLNMGRQGGGAPIAILGRPGVLHQLENVLGDKGKAMADDIRALVGDIDPATGLPVKPGHLGENEFLQATTNYRQSATIPNAEALEQGPSIYGSDLANSMPVSMGTDAAMMASGMTSVPLLTAMRHGPGFAKKLFMPRTATREDMTRVLLARQKQDGTYAVEPPAGAGPEGGAPGGGRGGPPIVSPEERAMLLGQPDLPAENVPAMMRPRETPARPQPTFGRRKRPPPEQSGMFASRGMREAGAPAYEPRDLVLGYNDGDSFRDMALDFELDGYQAGTQISRRLHGKDELAEADIENRLSVQASRMRNELARAREQGQLQRVADEMRVSVDELERFIDKRPHPYSGQFEKTIARIVNMAERAARSGRPLRMKEIAERTDSTVGSVKALLSQARSGAKPLPAGLKARLDNLPRFGAGRPPALNGDLGDGVELAAMFGAGAQGWSQAGDMDGDGEVSVRERLLQAGMNSLGTKFATGAARSVLGRRGQKTADESPQAANFAGRSATVPHQLAEDYVPDATTAGLRRIQQAYIDRGEVPPVFKVFRKPNGQVVAWRGDGDPRGGLSHDAARDALGLGDQRLEHGTFAGLNADLDKLAWSGVSGEGPAPRSVEKLVRQKVLTGGDPGEAIWDAFPYEVERDLRAIGAAGPDKGFGNYSFRRSQAMRDVKDEGHSVSWRTADGQDARVQFSPGGRPGQEIVQFRIGNRTTPEVENASSVSMSDAKAFEKAMAVTEREVIKRGRDVYLFDGSGPGQSAFYLRSLERYGAPQGYVGLVDPSGGKFAFVRKEHFDAEIAAGRIDPNRVKVIPSKRGDKAVPEWRRHTGQFAVPLVAGGTGAALFGPQRSDEPRAQ